MMVEVSGLAQTDPGVLATSGMISDDHTEVTSKDPGLISRCVSARARACVRVCVRARARVSMCMWHISVLEQRRFNISG